MAVPLPTGRYPEVRQALDPSLPDTALPDSLIGSDVYAGEAARWVTARDATAAARTGEEGAAIERAQVFYTASLLAAVLPSVTSSKQDDHAMTYTRKSAGELAALLLSRAEATMDALVAAPEASVIPTFFMAAPGRRA